MTAEEERALDFALEWPDLDLRGRLKAILDGTYDPALDEFHRPLCAVVSASGRFGEPLACGYRRNHDGPHAWSTLPTFSEGTQP